MKVGRTFWLLPAPINPLMVKVTITEITEKGLVVDEPVGYVINTNCIFFTREQAENFLREFHASGQAIINDDAPKTLPELRQMLLRVSLRNRYDQIIPVLRDKKRGEEWFTIEDINDDPKRSS